MQLLRKLRRERGIRSEDRVQSALLALQQCQDSKVEGFEGANYIVLGFYPTKRLSPDDIQGKDFEVRVLAGPEFETSFEIYIQVKSSKGLAKKHLQSHPDIPVIVVDPLKTDGDLVSELDKIIREELKHASC